MHGKVLNEPREFIMKPATVKKLLAAFDAMVIVAHWGQPCYRTANDVPMGMPRKVEKVVRTALRTLKKIK